MHKTTVSDGPRGIGGQPWVFSKRSEFDSGLKLNNWKRAVKANIEIPTSDDINNAESG